MARNLRVCAGGCVYYVDIAFRYQRLAIEFSWRMIDDHPEVFITEVRRALMVGDRAWSQ